MIGGLLLAAAWFLSGPDAAGAVGDGPAPIAFLGGAQPAPAAILPPSTVTAGADPIDLSRALIVDSPGDVANWPATVSITHVSAAPDNVRFTINGLDRWPDVVPPGWEGPLQYTVWLFLWTGEQWAGSAFVQMWRGRDGVGDGIQDFAQNWYYAARWAPLYGHGVIQPGETIGFMVTAGNERDGGQVILQERSQVVTLQVPAGYAGEFDFAG